MNAEFLGIVYAADDTHHALSLECGEKRMLVFPEHWNTEQAYEWVNTRQWVSVRGLKAFGLTLIMRAEITPKDMQS